MEIRGELMRADFLLPLVVPRDPTKMVRLSSKRLKPLRSLFASTECVLQNKTKLAKQAAAGKLLEPGIRTQPSQFSQFLLQGTETNSLKKQRWKGHVSTVFPDQPGQQCKAVSKQQKKNKMKEQERR